MKIITNRFVSFSGEGAGLYWVGVRTGRAHPGVSVYTLYGIPENANGRSRLASTYDTDGAHEITAPESQDFLDWINEALGTSFKMEEFDGR